MLRQMNLTYGMTKYENENPSRLSLRQKRGYFKLLNNNEMVRLYAIYKQDFDLFEYDPHIFDSDIKIKMSDTFSRTLT